LCVRRPDVSPAVERVPDALDEALTTPGYKTIDKEPSCAH
jgi:hypothetical protein